MRLKREQGAPGGPPSSLLLVCWLNLKGCASVSLGGESSENKLIVLLDLREDALSQVRDAYSESMQGEKGEGK